MKVTKVSLVYCVCYKRPPLLKSGGAGRPATSITARGVGTWVFTDPCGGWYAFLQRDSTPSPRLLKLDVEFELSCLKVKKKNV